MAHRKRQATSPYFVPEEAKKMKLFWKCEHCERTFDFKINRTIHVDYVHKCHICSNIVQDCDKIDHAEMHKREKAEKMEADGKKKAEEEEAERKKKVFYDDIVEKFIRTKKLNEYQSDEKLDFEYIFENYRTDIDDEQLLFFVKHGMNISNYGKLLNDRQIIFLLDNNAISEENAADCIDCNTCTREQLIDYFLEKNFVIEPRWVAELIKNGALIERIKEKHNFTFQDIFSEGVFWNEETRNDFYDAVCVHFPNQKLKLPPKKQKTASGIVSVEAKEINLKWKCEHCERAFRTENGRNDHTRAVHKCRICSKIVKINDRKDHAEMHKREKAEKEEAERKKKLFYDDIVEKFIRTKKLNEYQSDEKLDFEYIFENYRTDIDNEQLLFFVKHGMNIDACDELLNDEQIIFLLENGGISVEEAADFIEYNPQESERLIDYFLEKNFAIEPRWVAELIDDDDLIKRIKEKHNFEFEDIFSEGSDLQTRDSYCTKQFYAAVHAHFPDPNYKEPKKFECVTTKYVDDYLHSRYLYDEEKDELSIRVGYDNRKISLGPCKKMIEYENLVDLIAKYRYAIEKYDEANRKVSEVFDEIEDVTDDEYDSPRYDFFGDRKYREADSVRYDLYRDLSSEYLPNRNYWANIVSRTYFVIAQKSDTVPTLKNLAMRKIVKEKINFDQLPPSLKQKMAELKSV